VVESSIIASETDTFVLDPAPFTASFKEPRPKESPPELSKNNAPLILTLSSVSSVLNKTPAILGSPSAWIRMFAFVALSDLK